MSTSTLQNFRVGSDLTVKVRLKDGGVAIDWSTLSGIRAVLYSDAQSSIAGRCDVTVDGEDPTLLVCRYAATKMQYLGVNRIIVSAKYMGETKTYDKPAFTFVRWTADQEGEQITIEDPEVTVEISVEDISSSILQEAVDAAFSAADRANDAAEAAEHMVDIHTGPEGKSAYEVAVEEGYTGTEEEWLASLKGPVGETPNISIGTVTTVEPGTPAEATMTGTPEAPVLNLSIPKGLVGATPNFTVGTVTTGEPGSSVIVTITGTPEAPVLNLMIPQGMQGNTGSSVDYPYELVNNLTTNDATKGLSAAQGYVLDGKVSQLEAKVYELGGGTYQPILNIEQGIIDTTTGEDAPSTTRLRTSNYINADSIAIMTSGSKVAVAGYKNDGTFVSGSAWITASTTMQIPGAEKYRFVFSKADNSTITPSDFSSLGISIFSVMEGELQEQKTEIESVKDITTAQHFLALDLASLSEEDNYHHYCYAPNGVGYPATFPTSPDASVLRVSVQSGEIYHIRSANYYSLKSWIILDADGNVTRLCASGNTTPINDTITIQDGEVTLCVNIHIYGFMLVAKKTLISPLAFSGKLVVFDGDSICEARLTGNQRNGGAYPYLIARNFGIDIINYAKGGATLSQSSTSGASHSVADSVASYADADIYCIEGGINDFWLNVPLGTMSGDYSQAVTPDSVIGAMEYIFRYLLTNKVGKPICFVLSHKCQNTETSTNSTGKTFREYHDAMLQVCKRYSIPVYDAYDESGLNGWNSAQSSAFLTSNNTGTADGTHPNEDGYKKYYLYQMKSLLERINPKN